MQRPESQIVKLEESLSELFHQLANLKSEGASGALSRYDSSITSHGDSHQSVTIAERRDILNATADQRWYKEFGFVKCFASGFILHLLSHLLEE